MPSSTLDRRPAQSRRPAAEPDERREPGLDAPFPKYLWSPTIVARWAGAGAVAGVVLTIAWFVIGGKAEWNDQRPWMTVGIASFVVLSFISINLLLAGRRLVGLRRVALLGDLPLVAAGPAEQSGPLTTASTSEVLVAGEGLVRFHRSDCPLTAGRDYQPSDRATHTAAGRQPCGVCLP